VNPSWISWCEFFTIPPFLILSRYVSFLLSLCIRPNVPHHSIQWFSQHRLVPRLVDMLSAQHTPDMHVVVNELITRIISMAAPSPGSGVGDGPGAQIGPSSNRFARQLAARETVEQLVGYLLQDFPVDQPQKQDEVGATEVASADVLPNVRSATSSVINSISVIVELIRKNNSDYFEPYLFHTVRNRLIQVQQQQPMQNEDGHKSLEDAMEDMVNRMGVVHLGPLLDIMCENMEKLQALLHKPRSLVRLSPFYGLFASETKSLSWDPFRPLSELSRR
jgi:serine/threonine-protein phosphatase 6 regulatory subunit 3